MSNQTRKETNQDKGMVKNFLNFYQQNQAAQNAKKQELVAKLKQKMDKSND